MALTPESALRKDRLEPAPMQHRHFATIATIIREMPEDVAEQRELAKYFADRLASTNPRFDRARFLRACEQ